MITKPIATPIVPILECSPTCDSCINSSTTFETYFFTILCINSLSIILNASLKYKHKVFDFLKSFLLIFNNLIFEQIFLILIKKLR